MEEYNIWSKIFECDDDITLETLVELVVKDEDARDLVLNNLIKYKEEPKQMVKVNVNIDKELKDLPVDEILAQVSRDVFRQMQ